MQQQQVDWFESWFGSPYYSILYQNRDMAEAAAFVDRLVAYLAPPAGSRMVDIACGEGRYAIQLAKKGFDVTGIDLAANSIEQAKKHEHEHLRFFVHDMRFPFYINYFDYAFNFFTSFGYFSSARDHALAASSFMSSLKKGGILIIDYLNKEYALKQLTPKAMVQRNGYHFYINKKLEDGYFKKEIRFTDKNGTERKFVEKVAAFSFSELCSLFEHAGGILVDSFGDYDLKPFETSKSSRTILMFKKS